MFQSKFAILTPALITGAFAERIRFKSYLLFASLFCICVYAPIAHWVWHPDGFLYRLGVVDFAGGTVVHISAGFAALMGAIVVGQRNAHKNKELEPAANFPFVILGTGILWFGWFGFNAGSALAVNSTAVMALVNTNTASASAVLAWIVLDLARGRKPSALGACEAAVIGLVAITPAAGFVTVGASFFIGTVSSLICNCAIQCKARTTLDDTLDVFPCHGVAGMLGMLMTGIFAHPDPNSSALGKALLPNVFAVFIVSAFAATMSWILYKMVDWIIPLRVSEKEERDGLDFADHFEIVQPLLTKNEFPAGVPVNRRWRDDESVVGTTLAS
jgi:Amt family ammonium transporter